jgi:uncharacterized protein YicC (UPF0701 family)
VRDRVRAVAQRGRVEVTIARAAVASRRRYVVAVRAELARAYVDAARRLARHARARGRRSRSPTSSGCPSSSR